MGGISLKTGSTIRAAVLDVAKIERLVELSVKPTFVDKLKEKTSSMEANKKVGFLVSFWNTICCLFTCFLSFLFINHRTFFSLHILLYVEKVSGKHGT